MRVFVRVAISDKDGSVENVAGGTTANVPEQQIENTTEHMLTIDGVPRDGPGTFIRENLRHTTEGWQLRDCTVREGWPETDVAAHDATGHP